MSFSARTAGRDLEGARARFDAAHLVFHDVGDRDAEARASANLAVLLRRMRRLPEALAMARDARTALFEIGNAWSANHALALVAQIELDSGNLVRARADCEETLRRLNSPNLGRDLIELAEVELRQGALADARLTVARAQAAPQKEKFTEPLQDLLLARLALEEDDPAEAEVLARRSVEKLGSFERNDEAAGAGAVLALALLARGKAADARRAADTAAALITQASDFHPMVALAQARASAAERPELLPASIAAAQAVEAEARRTGVVDDLLEAEFTLGVLENAAGRTGARARLVALASDARARGYLAIAGRAEALARKASAAAAR